MRPDLKKVICEKERKGDRSYTGGNDSWERDHRPKRNHHEDTSDDYSQLECLPKNESMTRRLSYRGTRDFSENLGALRGLIFKNVGKNWDKLYSAICAQVSPTGTNIERHVHQHLTDFIETKTRMGERGVEIHGYSRSVRLRGLQWVTLADYYSFHNCRHYVHPVTRCIVRLKKQQSRRDFGLRAPAEITRIDIDPAHQLHKINGIWWIVTIAEIPKHAYKKENVKREFEDAKYVFYSVKEYIELPSRDVLVPDPLGRYHASTLREHYGRTGVYGLRKCAANHKVLKSAGLAA